MTIRWHSLKQSTVMGLVGGGALLLGMMLIAPQHIGAFFNIPGLIVVLGGTLAATLVCRPVEDVKRALRTIPELLSDEEPTKAGELDQMLRIAEFYRRGNVRAAENALRSVTDPFLRRGLQLVLDRYPLPQVNRALQLHIEGKQTRELVDAHILRTMANYAPAFGMLGTLFGLVHMLHEMGGTDLSGIGPAMGFAMITTLYGIVAANLVLKPLAMKKENRVRHEISRMSIFAEGIQLIHARQHPTLIKETLEGSLLRDGDDEVSSRKVALLKAA